MGMIGGSCVRNRGEFPVLGGDNLFGFLGSLSSFQPCLRVIRKYLGVDFIL
jgi:hypothetical protein